MPVRKAANKAAPAKKRTRRRTTKKTEPKAPAPVDKPLPVDLYVQPPEGATLKEKGAFCKLVFQWPPQHFLECDVPSLLLYLDLETRLDQIRQELRSTTYWTTENDQGTEQEHPFVKLESRWLKDRRELAQQLRITPQDRDRLYGYLRAPDVENLDKQGQLLPPGSEKKTARVLFVESDEPIDAEYEEIPDDD